MDKRYGRITGWGSYVPEKILTNHDLEKIMDTSHDWIVQRTGIYERRMAAPHETTASMAVAASRLALQRASLHPADLDLIILATNTPNHIVTPPTSSQVQHMLGAPNVPALTMVTGCTAFVYALVTAYQFVAAGTYENILIVGSETLMRFMDWNDRSTSILFGDGAGAFVMQATPEPCGLLSFELGSDGSGADYLLVPAGGSAEPINATTYAEGRHYVQMNGREVFKFATRVIGESSQRVLAKAGLGVEDLDWIVPHQANMRIIRAAARSMNLSLDHFVINIEKYANTGAASIPVAICEALNSGQVQPDETLLVSSFGAGLTWATAILQLAPISHRVHQINYRPELTALNKNFAL
jgi:3-oxoacyl-[acyl-carrier-protein] synthase-3